MPFPYWQSNFIKLFDGGLPCEFIRTFLSWYSLHGGLALFYFLHWSKGNKQQGFSLFPPFECICYSECFDFWLWCALCKINRILIRTKCSDQLQLEILMKLWDHLKFKWEFFHCQARGRGKSHITMRTWKCENFSRSSHLWLLISYIHSDYTQGRILIWNYWKKFAEMFFSRVPSPLLISGIWGIFVKKFNDTNLSMFGPFDAGSRRKLCLFRGPRIARKFLR